MRDLVLTVLKKWLHLEHETDVDVILATAVASLFPGERLWLFVIGPPGSAKSELVRGFRGPSVYTLDNMTDSTLVSGFHGKRDNSILPALNNKLLVVKEFTPLLTKSHDKREAIFSQLRAIYDGTYSTAYGSGAGRREYNVSFGMIAAVTPAIDQHRAIHSILGERFLSLRLQTNAQKSIDGTEKNHQQEQQMRAEIGAILEAFMSYYKETGVQHLPQRTPDMQKLKGLALTIGQLRTPVHRDYRGQLHFTPVAEVGTRLYKQLLLLSQALILIGAYDYSVIEGVARDCVLPDRLKVFDHLQAQESTIPDVATGCRLPRSTASLYLEDLWLLDLAQRRLDGNQYIYSLTQ